MAWGLLLSSSQWAFHIPHSEWLLCHWVVIMHRGHIVLVLLQKKMRRVEKNGIFSDSVCSQKFLPLSSFHEMFVNTAHWRKNWVIICFFFHQISKRNVILHVQGMRACLLSVKVPRSTEVLNQICWKVLLWVILVSSLFSDQWLRIFPSRWELSAWPGWAGAHFLAAALLGWAVAARRVWGIHSWFGCCWAGLPQLQGWLYMFSPHQCAAEKESLGESTQPGQLTQHMMSAQHCVLGYIQSVIKGI